MGGIDVLVSESFSDVFKNKLDKKILKEFERKLFEKTGLSIKLSVENFKELNKVLRIYLGNETESFEKKCINTIFSLKKSKSNNEYNIKIIDQNLSKKIMNYWGDYESRKILNQLFDESYTIPKIIKICDLPKTSGYRKIDSLIRDGILVQTGIVLSKSKKVAKFKNIFLGINIKIRKNLITVEGQISKKDIESSSIFSILR